MADSDRPLVLVTGANGTIGRAVIGLLGEQFSFHGLDISVPDSDGTSIPFTTANAAELEAILPSFEGVDCVVHLAARVALDASWESILENNIVATRNVFEAARRSGVRRVVFASSNHAVGGYEQREPYRSIIAGDHRGLGPDEFPRLDHLSPLAPDSDYGSAKAFGEALGMQYHELYGLEVACLRIGTVNPANRPENLRQLVTWQSYRDLAQLVGLCVSRPLGFEIFYGVSANTWRIWDIEHARNSVGYEPQDNADHWRASIST